MSMSTRRDKETLTLRERETPFPPPLSHHSPPIPLVSSSNLQISWSHSNCTTSSPWEFSSILGCIYGIQLNSSPGIQWVSLKHHLLKSCKVQLSSVRRNPAQTIYYCTQNWITAASENFSTPVQAFTEPTSPLSGTKRSTAINNNNNHIL